MAAQPLVFLRNLEGAMEANIRVNSTKLLRLMLADSKNPTEVRVFCGNVVFQVKLYAKLTFW